MVGAWLPKAGRAWNKTEEALIERLWNDGMSPAAISEKMNGDRIPSVILAHLRVMERRGTKFKFTLGSHSGSDVISRRFKALRLRRVDGWVPPPSPPVVGSRPQLLQDIPNACCHFPVDDPRPGTYFCAEPVRPHGRTEPVPIYCTIHHAVAFRESEHTRIRPPYVRPTAVQHPRANR